MQDHGVIFPEVSEFTKRVMVTAFSQLHRQDEWSRIMDTLGIPRGERYQIDNELASLHGFFRRVWTKEMKAREQRGEEGFPLDVNAQPRDASGIPTTRTEAARERTEQ